MLSLWNMKLWLFPPPSLVGWPNKAPEVEEVLGFGLLTVPWSDRVLRRGEGVILLCCNWLLLLLIKRNPHTRTFPTKHASFSLG